MVARYECCQPHPGSYTSKPKTEGYDRPSPNDVSYLHHYPFYGNYHYKRYRLVQ
jgi:hypothetical protein